MTITLHIWTVLLGVNIGVVLYLWSEMGNPIDDFFALVFIVVFTLLAWLIYFAARTLFGMPA